MNVDILPPLEEEVRVLYGNSWETARRVRYERSWRWYSRLYSAYLITGEVTAWEPLT